MSDQRMPGMTGVEVLRHAKKVRPAATRLLFTAYADIRAVIDAINQGSVFQYITKPWEPDELQAILRQAVEQHNLIVENARLMAELKESNLRLAEANRLKTRVHRGGQPRAEHAGGGRPGNGRTLEEHPEHRSVGRRARLGGSGPGRGPSTGLDDRAHVQVDPGR